MRKTPGPFPAKTGRKSALHLFRSLVHYGHHGVRVHLTVKRILLVIALCLGAQYSRAEVGIGLGWPYASVKYNMSDRTAVEARYAAGSGVNVLAGRLYWNFSKYSKIKSDEKFDYPALYKAQHIKPNISYENRLDLFTGFEGGYVKFNTLDMTGTGYECAVLAGGEYFFSKRVSLMLDFSPTLIGLKSDGYKVNGVEWVLNMGIYFYL